MTVSALIWKETKSAPGNMVLSVCIGLLLAASFLWSGDRGPLFVLYLQVFTGYLPLRASFLEEVRAKSLESLFAAPCDGRVLWAVKSGIYSIFAVAFSLLLVVPISFTVQPGINPAGLLLVSPLTFVLLGLVGAQYLRVLQPYADIVAFLVLAALPVIFLHLPLSGSVLLAVCLIVVAYLLSSDKEAIIRI